MARTPVRALVAVVAAALLAAGIAHADTTDDQFLTLLASHGLDVGPPDQMIALAHKRCDANGLSRADWFTLRYYGRPSPFVAALSNINTKLQSQGLTDDQVVQFMRDAVAVYCPNTTG
jgi:Protein of unknown function (DUF732)